MNNQENKDLFEGNSLLISAQLAIVSTCVLSNILVEQFSSTAKAIVRSKNLNIVFIIFLKLSILISFF